MQDKIREVVGQMLELEARAQDLKIQELKLRLSALKILTSSGIDGRSAYDLLKRAMSEQRVSNQYGWIKELKLEIKKELSKAGTAVTTHETSSRCDLDQSKGDMAVPRYTVGHKIETLGQLCELYERGHKFFICDSVGDPDELTDLHGTAMAQVVRLIKNESLFFAIDQRMLEQLVKPEAKSQKIPITSMNRHVE